MKTYKKKRVKLCRGTPSIGGKKVVDDNYKK